MKAIQTNEQEKAEAIIALCKICYVGFADTDGTPHVIPMNFGYENGIIYLHSGPEGYLLEVLERNNKLCITFCSGDNIVFQHPDVACSYSMRSDSVICRGSVVFIEDIDEKAQALNTLMANYTNRPFTYSVPAITHVKVWKIEVKSFNAKSIGLTHKQYLSRVKDM